MTYADGVVALWSARSLALYARAALRVAFHAKAEGRAHTLAKRIAHLRRSVAKLFTQDQPKE